MKYHNADVCNAYGCSNLTGKSKGKAFFKIPDPEINYDLCRRWLHNIGNAKLSIKNFKPKPHNVVCIDHFDPVCIQRDFRSEMVPSFRKNIKIVPGAIPTIFQHKFYDQIDIDGTLSLNRRPSKRVLEQERK